MKHKGSSSYLGEMEPYKVIHRLKWLQITPNKIEWRICGWQEKGLIREFYHLCQFFSCVKYLFKLVTHHQTLNFPKIFMYDDFSQMI